MSLLCKLNNFSKSLNKKLISNGPITSLLFYSRRSDSKNSGSPYKVVKSKINLDADWNGTEGNANWELLAPKGNRFYLPGCLGPAWQNSTTTVNNVVSSVTELVDFESKTRNKLHISTKICPLLLRKNLHELFPAPEVVSSPSLTLVTLMTNRLDTEDGAKKFVLAAREICSKLRMGGYWADFMNPFSGKPFYSYASGKNLYKIDERFRGLCIKFEDLHDCTIITADENVSFSGVIFTNLPSDLTLLQKLMDVHN